MLDAGQSFTDSALGLWLTALSADSTGSFVDVSFDGAACVTAPPTISLSPGSTAWTAPSIPVGYTVQVTNGDSAGCTTSAFSLASTVPSGWIGSFGASSLLTDIERQLEHFLTDRYSAAHRHAMA